MVKLKRQALHDDVGQVVEVNQEEVKKALEILLTARNDILGTLYAAYNTANADKFHGALSKPVITIDKMDNRTLASRFRDGRGRIGVDNHIRFNENFIALNGLERVLLTLQHEMIHTWQDEIAYKGMDRKPKDWHNKDFRTKAEEIGIPCEGPNCSTGPCRMPKAKSYNRKFSCGCRASNGYLLTVWSTRAIDATCNICGRPFQELPKNGDVIKVVASHIEKAKAKVDAVEQTFKNDGYDGFKRFKDREAMVVAIDKLLDGGGDNMPAGVAAHGVYQKHHNFYEKGWRYWVAYNTTQVEKLIAAKAAAAATTSKPKAQPKRATPKAKGAEAGVTSSS